MLKDLQSDLRRLADSSKIPQAQKFFQTGVGQYGEGDKFLGVTVPNQRKIAGKYPDLDLKDLQSLLSSNIHEYRLTALFILVGQYKKAKKKPSARKKLVDFYLKNTENVNNWDLVDSSAHYILGDYLLNLIYHSRKSGNDRMVNVDSRLRGNDKTDFHGNDRMVLYKLANSKNLWERRIAIISTFAFVRAEQFDDTLKILEILLNDKHDLIHKAVGWMLREIGKRNQKIEEEFLAKYYKQMPRTMLRYAIEKFVKGKREKYLQGTV